VPQLDGIRKINTNKIKSIKIKKSFHFGFYYKFKNVMIFLLALIISIFGLYLLVSNVSYLSSRANLIKQIYEGKYLILFQNNSELRSSGGFIGSFALAQTKMFQISKMDINTNIYKIDDKYDYILQIEPPEQMLKTVLGKRKYWAMRDSNWSPDYPTSAQKVAWFYRQEGGESVDGVFAINATVVADILKITGPIDIKQKKLTISSDNFFEALFNEIENNYYNDPINVTINEPKEILKDIYPILLEKVKQKQYRWQVLKLIIKEFRENQIQLFSSNQLLENNFRWFGVAGEYKKVNNPDYLNINNANIGGNKSSFSINQKTSLNVFVDDNGTITDTLNIIRIHSGNDIWPDGDNISYQRIIVPDGAILINAELDGQDILKDVEITKESGKTVFGYRFDTSVGQTKSANITYQLPKKIKNINDYSLYWQKQSGVISDDLQVITNGQVIFSNAIRTNLELK